MVPKRKKKDGWDSDSDKDEDIDNPEHKSTDSLEEDEELDENIAKLLKLVEKEDEEYYLDL